MKLYNNKTESLWGFSYRSNRFKIGCVVSVI